MGLQQSPEEDRDMSSGSILSLPGVVRNPEQLHVATNNFFDQQRQALVCDLVLAARLNRSRLGPIEGPAIESPQLCRGMVTRRMADR